MNQRDRNLCLRAEVELGQGVGLRGSSPEVGDRDSWSGVGAADRLDLTESCSLAERGARTETRLG